MSHYNNNANSAANSWQSRPNNASTTAGLYGQHDLTNPNSYNTNSTNNSVGGNNGPNNPASSFNPAASLLAQFAVNGVSFGNLAANLPATLLSNPNLLGSQGLAAVGNANQGLNFINYLSINCKATEKLLSILN